MIKNNKYKLESKRININYKNLNDNSISGEMFHWILDNIHKGDTIVELGSGYGTIELCKFFNVYTIEHDKKWLYKTHNAYYVYAPLKDGWYDVNKIITSLPDHYSLLIVDGPPGILNKNKNQKIEIRSGFYDNFDIFRKDIPIIIDDSNRDLDRILIGRIMERYHYNIEEFIGHQKNFVVLKK